MILSLNESDHAMLAEYTLPAQALVFQAAENISPTNAIMDIRKPLVILGPQDKMALFDMAEQAIIRNDITSFSWLNDHTVAYSTGLEIWAYNTITKNHWLIDRGSETVKSIAWHPSGAYVAVTTSGTGLIELDDRDMRHRVPLGIESDFHFLRFSADGTRVYVVSHEVNRVMRIQ